MKVNFHYILAHPFPSKYLILQHRDTLHRDGYGLLHPGHVLWVHHCVLKLREHMFLGPKIKHKGPTSLVDMNLLEAATQAIAAALSLLHLWRKQTHAQKSVLSQNILPVLLALFCQKLHHQRRTAWELDESSPAMSLLVRRSKLHEPDWKFFS